MAREADDIVFESNRLADAPAPWETLALFGHVAAERQLLEAFRSDRLPNAYIIAGPEGIGKATLAFRFARFMLTHQDPAAAAVTTAQSLAVAPEDPVARRIAANAHGDITVLRREYNERTRKHFSEIRVDDVRKLLHRFHHAAAAGGYRIAILDSAEDLNRAGANALLKIIEEPPPKSLFLIIATRPGALLPTIRSRCRLLRLAPLPQMAVVQAVEALGQPWSKTAAEAIARAAARAGGSVRQALRLLDSDALTLLNETHRLLAHLPSIDWRKVHQLADEVGSDPVAGFDSVFGAILDWIDARVQAGSGDGVAHLAPLAEVWEKASVAARETEALNLDRRPLILSIFAQLATAMGGGVR
jgi:DNA polymerase-3 subunit delta'